MRLTEELTSGQLAESWKVVTQYFGCDRTEVIDNIIEQSDRPHFYRLEEMGFMESRVEQVTLPEGGNGYSGRLWRIHYWRLKGHPQPNIHIV